MPAGFFYDALTAENVNSFRNFLALCGTSEQVKVELFSLNTSVGLQAITGVGFQPQMVGIIGVAKAGPLPMGVVRGSAFHVGFAAGSSQWAGSLAGEYNKFTWSADRHSYWTDTKIIAMQGVSGGAAPVTSAFAELDSFDSDGFTLDITQAPSEAILCIYIAARAGGGYAVGTTQVPLVTGNQAITGLSFAPKGVFFANGPGGLLQQSHEWIGLGGADSTLEDYAVWAGTRTGFPQMGARYDTGKCITFAASPTGGGGAGRAVLAQASLAAMTPDGFLLNWDTVDGSIKYYHWLAVASEADVSRFLFDGTANDVFVPTSAEPKGIIGFGTDQETEGWETTRAAASVGMSFIGQDVTKEWSASFHEGFPSTLSITANRREIKPGSMGAYSLNIGGLNGSFRNLVDIVFIQGVARIVNMNWRYAQRHKSASRGLINPSDIP